MGPKKKKKMLEDELWEENYDEDEDDPWSKKADEYGYDD